MLGNLIICTFYMIFNVLPKEINMNGTIMK